MITFFHFFNPISHLEFAMERRNARLRREYLYRKSLESKDAYVWIYFQEYVEMMLPCGVLVWFMPLPPWYKDYISFEIYRSPRVVFKYQWDYDNLSYISGQYLILFSFLPISERSEDYENKRRLKVALEEGKTIPTDLRENASSIKQGLELDDPDVQPLKTHLDDEYQKVGVYDPKILMTTSRDPSSRLMQFSKEMRICFPNCQRINRGRTQMGELVDICRQNDFTDLVILHEHNGEPDGLIISHFPYGPTAYFSLSGCVLRHDLNAEMGTMSEAFPHLIFHNFSTKLGERTKTILQSLFPIPKEDSKRIMTFVNRDDTISYRHHIYKRMLSYSFFFPIVIAYFIRWLVCLSM